jgi:lysozyme family protein
MDAIDDILRREGGFVNHPADRGGPTNFGVTQRTLSAWLGRPATLDDVRNLTREEARKIYENEYLHRPKIDRISDQALREQVLDAAVLHGPATAVKMLQRALGVDDDGAIGPDTLSALGGADAAAIGRRFTMQRIRFIGGIITDDPALRRAKEAGFRLQAEFAKGWLNRVTEFLT